MVVSSEIPTKSFVNLLNIWGSFSNYCLIKVKTILYSWEVAVDGSGSKLFFYNYFSNLRPSTNKRVASPPSSTIVVGPLPSGQTKALIVQSQYSSKVSPFQANTGVPALATAAAAFYIKLIQNLIFYMFV